MPAIPSAAIAAAFRAAYRGKTLWHRIRRPLSLGVRVILPDEAGGVLLIRHSYIGGWHLPGGGVGKGESLAAAARREVGEEVGLDAGPALDMLGVYARFRHGASDHVALFLARQWRGIPRVDGREVVEAAFFPAADPPADTSPGTARRLAEWTGGMKAAEHW